MEPRFTTGSPAADKSAWRARIRASRRHDLAAGPDGAGAALARTALSWLAGDAQPNPAGLTDLSPWNDMSDAGDPLPPAPSPPTVGAVCAFLATGTEPPTEPLLRAVVGTGRAVYVPVCEPGFRMSWVRWFPGVALAPSILAPVNEPVGPRIPFRKIGPGGTGTGEMGPVAAVLIPALAVDRSGTRLGQGGGYYDRFLAALGQDPAPALTVAAVVREKEIFPAGTLPHDELDIPVRHVLTERGHSRLG